MQARLSLSSFSLQSRPSTLTSQIRIFIRCLTHEKNNLMYTHYLFIAHRQLTMCLVFTKLQRHLKGENNTPVNFVHSSSKRGVLAMRMELDI